LIISIKVDKRDSIDKVSYNLDEEEKTFNLVVQPKKGELPLKKDAVSFSYSGAQADLVIIVGGNRFEDLGVFYETERSLFTEAKTINISRFANTPFADFHVTDGQVTSLAELSLELTQTLGVTVSTDAATAFLSGIDTATQNLQSPAVTADTFEKVAYLMRAGGLRQITRPNNSNPVSSSPAPAAAPNPQPVPQEWLTPKIYKSPAPAPTNPQA
jgi:hypothetical protein